MKTPVEGGDHGATAVKQQPARGAPKQKALFPESGAPVTIDRRTLPLPPKVPTARFWVGTMPEVDGEPNPIQQCTKGIGFQRYEGNPEIRVTNNEARIIGNPNLGMVIDLTEEQYEMVIERVSCAVVRNTRARDVVSMRHPRFREYPDDKPLGKFLYMVRVGDTMPRDWRKHPTPMVN